MMLFVYYKFVPDQFPEIVSQVEALEQAVSNAFPDIQMRVLRRPAEDSAGQQTWMEMYELDQSSLESLRETLDRQVAMIGLPGKRAVEVFVDK